MAVSDYSPSAGSNITISGINIGEGMDRDDVNNAMRQMMADSKVFYNAVVGSDQGVVAGGSVNGLTSDRYFTGAVDGSTVYYGAVERTTAQGANAIAEVRNKYLGLNVNTTGNVTTAIHDHAFVWKANAGNITNLRVREAHVRHDGPGVVSIAKNYNVVSVTLGASSTITQMEGYAAGEIGHDTKIDRAYDFAAFDGSACVTRRASFYSELGANAKKWALYLVGGAQSAMLGWLSIGKTTAPAEALDVTGNALVSGVYKVGGNQVVGARQTGTAANATDLATALTLVNDLKAKLIAHGLIS